MMTTLQQTNSDCRRFNDLVGRELFTEVVTISSVAEFDEAMEGWSQLSIRTRQSFAQLYSHGGGQLAAEWWGEQSREVREMVHKRASRHVWMLLGNQSPELPEIVAKTIFWDVAVAAQCLFIADRVRDDKIESIANVLDRMQRISLPSVATSCQGVQDMTLYVFSSC